MAVSSLSGDCFDVSRGLQSGRLSHAACLRSGHALYARGDRGLYAGPGGCHDASAGGTGRLVLVGWDVRGGSVSALLRRKTGGIEFYGQGQPTPARVRSLSPGGSGDHGRREEIGMKLAVVVGPV